MAGDSEFGGVDMHRDEVNMEILKLEFADFDRELGAFLLRCTASDAPEISLTGMLTAYELRSGNPQLDLAAYAGKTIESSPEEYVTLPSVEAWKEILQVFLLISRVPHR